VQVKPQSSREASAVLKRSYKKDSTKAIISFRRS